MKRWLHDGRGMDARSHRLPPGLASGLLGMLSTIMRPMLAAMDGRDFRSFMEAFLQYAGKSWGKA